MNSLRIALTELRRITAGRMSKIVVVALVLVPTLYGGLYLYANHDPYGRLSEVPAAIVVEDTGTTLPDGTELRAGDDVADELMSSGDFDWHLVSAEEAADGVRRGDFDFALEIPRDFSAALGGAASYEPEQAQLTMTTNDANSYLSTTIADTVSTSVRAAIAQRVGAEAATQFLLGLGDIRSQLESARNGARQVNNGAERALEGARDLRRGANTLAEGAEELRSGLGTLADQTADLPQQTRRLADGARQVADGNARVARIGDEVAGAASDVRDAYRDGRQDLVDVLDQQELTPEQRQAVLGVYDDLGEPVRRVDSDIQQASNDLDRLSSGAAEVADGNERLADSVPALVGGIGDARDGAGSVADGAGRLSDGAGTLASGLVELTDGTGQLLRGLRQGVNQIPDVDEDLRKQLAETISNPVSVTSSSQASAGSYGAGLAPFFMSLAAWIGAYVLFLLVRPLSQRATAANQTPVRVALGGWLTPALIGLVQVSVLLVVVSLGVGIVPANIPGTLLFLALASATFVAIVHALNAWLGATGQFLGLVLMVLQLVSAGGTFPWQTIPQPLYVVHHVLPMSYAVDGLRQLMYGGLDTLVLRDVAVLGAWLLLAILASSRAARRQRIWTVKRVKPEVVI